MNTLLKNLIVAFSCIVPASLAAMQHELEFNFDKQEFEQVLQQAKICSEKLKRELARTKSTEEYRELSPVLDALAMSAAAAWYATHLANQAYEQKYLCKSPEPKTCHTLKYLTWPSD